MPQPTYIRPVLVNASSPFLGDLCALCKEPFSEADKLVICPQDGSRHHQACWEANGNRCTAYGCEGHGLVVEKRRRTVVHSAGPGSTGGNRPGRFSKVRTMPSSSMGCRQTCLVLLIALTIIFLAVGCFGLWALADYLVNEVLAGTYHPFTSFAGGSLASALALFGRL